MCFIILQYRYMLLSSELSHDGLFHSRSWHWYNDVHTLFNNLASYAAVRIIVPNLRLTYSLSVTYRGNLFSNNKALTAMIQFRHMQLCVQLKTLFILILGKLNSIVENSFNDWLLCDSICYTRDLIKHVDRGVVGELCFCSRHMFSVRYSFIITEC